MRESRTQESQEFEKFFAVVREKAKVQNSIFFIHCGEGHEFETADMEGEDLSGWLIPAADADEFEKEFIKNQVSTKWNPFVRFAIWAKDGDRISITFKRF